MAYQVAAVAGDCLCSIAHREGFQNCQEVRAQPANAGFLDQPLAAGDNITIPEWDDGGFLTKFATTKRTVLCCWRPAPPPQPRQVQIVRKTAPAASGVVANLGISRFHTSSGTTQEGITWVNDTQFGFDDPSNNDPNTFSVEVDDANVNGNLVTVRLEALQPVYAAGGWVIVQHQRFAAGAERNARTLSITARLQPALPGSHFWSPELRLVSTRDDKALRPLQTLLVTDLFDAAGNGVDIQILDQDVRAIYEYADCPRNAGEKCILAWHTTPLRRGREVGVEVRILRQNPDGTGNDNGFVLQQTMARRIATHCRRLFAQEELTFHVHRLDTVDLPCDMLTVGEPGGNDASGHIPGGALQGQAGFTLTNRPHGPGAAALVHNVAPILIANHQTPQQTANALALAINPFPNIQAQTIACAPERIHPAGSVDVVITCATGHVQVSNLTPIAQQDSAQVVSTIRFDAQHFNPLQPAGQARKGGPPMRRQLFKSFATDPQRLNVFVVGGDHTGLTTLSMHDLQGAGFDADAAVRNCISMGENQVEDHLPNDPHTLPHELLHALADADHVPWAADNLQLLFAGVSNWTPCVRISGPGYANHELYVVDDQRHTGWFTDPPAVGPGIIGHAILTTTLHARIAANGSLVFALR